MTDPESIQAFVNSKPKAARSFWQKLRNAFKQLRKKIDGTSAAEKKILRRMSTAERLWADAFQAASERANGVQQTSSKRVKTKARKPETTKSLTEKSRKNMRYSAKKKTADGGSLYDYTKSFAQQIDDWMKGKIPKNDSLLVGKTPAIFQKIGFNALPMTINQTHVDYAINGTKNADHMIGADGLKQLPQALEHPIAVIASKTQNGTSVVALLPFTHNGNTVIAPVVIDGFGYQNNIHSDRQQCCNQCAWQKERSYPLISRCTERLRKRQSLFVLLGQRKSHYAVTDSRGHNAQDVRTNT